MWCRKQAAAAILPLLLVGWLTGESSEALTTFGKSNTQGPKEVAPTAPPARQCSRQSDCIAVTSSSCVRTHYDAQTRCLCGDNSAPINGQCEAQTKTLYHSCTNSEECNDGLSCGTVNMTDRPPHLRMLGPKDTICLCDVENGFREKDHSCSGPCVNENMFGEKYQKDQQSCNDADILKTSMFAVIFVCCIRKLLVY